MVISATLLTFGLLVATTVIAFFGAIVIALGDSEGNSTRGVLFPIGILIFLTIAYALMTGIIRITV